MKTRFITGVSRGLGLALAQAALRRGDTVIGTVRSGTPNLLDNQARLHVLTLDMADVAAIQRVTLEAFELAGGRIDVLVNNAGYGLLGAMEDATDEEVEQLFAVDVFGPFRLIRTALPAMRSQRSGHILNITSIAGRAPGAGSSLYAAAKHALEGLSASLAQELSPFNIKVTAVAPGAFRTDFLSSHSIRKSPTKADGYEATVGKMDQAFGAMAGNQLGDPERAAAALLQLVDTPNPPIQLLLGSDALGRARQKLDVMIGDMDHWRDVSIGTDHKA